MVTHGTRARARAGEQGKGVASRFSRVAVSHTHTHTRTHTHRYRGGRFLGVASQGRRQGFPFLFFFASIWSRLDEKFCIHIAAGDVYCVCELMIIRSHLNNSELGVRQLRTFFGVQLGALFSNLGAQVVK